MVSFAVCQAAGAENPGPLVFSFDPPTNSVSTAEVDHIAGLPSSALSLLRKRCFFDAGFDGRRLRPDLLQGEGAWRYRAVELQGPTDRPTGWNMGFKSLRQLFYISTTTISCNTGTSKLFLLDQCTRTNAGQV